MPQGDNNSQCSKGFAFYKLPYNTAGAKSIVISTNRNNPTILASVKVHAGSGDVVWLTAAVGWRPADGNTDVIFKIWRNAPVTGALIYSVLVGGENKYERNYISSFSHVDTSLSDNVGEYEYILTVENISNTIANIKGPVTFTAVQINLN